MDIIENSLLIKCLECRLIGAPPKFTMSPPPALPAEFLTSELLQSLNFVENRQLARQLKNIKLKRCHLVQSYASSPSRPVDIMASSSSSSLSNLAMQHDHIPLTQEQSILVFLISFFLFLVVLSIAGIFTIKLIRVRRQFKEFKSLNKTSSTSTTTNMSKSNTMTSELVLTPKMLDANSSTNAFYNQLFETTKQFSSSSSSSSNASNYSPKQNQSSQYQHYLQAVPNCSGLFGGVGGYNNRNLLISSSTSSSSSSPTAAEYDEISSQAYSTTTTTTCPNTILQPIWYHPSVLLNHFNHHHHPNHMMFYPVVPNASSSSSSVAVVDPNRQSNVIIC